MLGFFIAGYAGYDLGYKTSETKWQARYNNLLTESNATVNRLQLKTISSQSEAIKIKATTASRDLDRYIASNPIGIIKINSNIIKIINDSMED